MRKIVTSSQMKNIEAYTINEVGVPSLVLMERAAFSVLEELEEEEKVLVVCGVGNNGADGLAVARMLKLRGQDVCVSIIGDESKSTEEFKVQKNICQNLGLTLVVGFNPDFKPDTIVDSIFGIGISREVTGVYYGAIAVINKHKADNGCHVISVDIPSGLGCDDGKPLGIAVVADKTVTFQYEKIGLILNEGPKYSGKVVVKDIGIVASVKETIAYTYDFVDISRYPDRDILGNKGTFGKVLLVTGSPSMPGASILTARTAFKMGTGMVKVLSSGANRDLLMHELPEAMFQSYDNISSDELDNILGWCDACLIGPGLSVNDGMVKLVCDIIKDCNKPLVIDADALNIIAKEGLAILRSRENRGLVTVLTPHPAEFARLAGCNVKQKKNADIEFLNDLSKAINCIVAAKDARTIVSSGCLPVYINTVTSESLATAGSGDIYGAIIASLLAMELNAIEATNLATLIHGMAGIEAGKQKGVASSMASDIIEAIGEIIN